MKKLADKITIVVFLLIVYGLSVAFFALPNSDFSQRENRTLQTTPKLTAKTLADGSFGKEVDDWFADQFPLRAGFVGLKAFSELSLQKGENNGVIVGSDGQLAVRLFDAYKSKLVRSENTDFYYQSNVEKQINAVNKLAETLQIPLVTLIPPRTVDVASSKLSYVSPATDELFLQLENGFSEKSGYCNAFSLLKDKYENGEYVYYRTDHHWTSLGAYYIYSSLAKQLSFTPVQLETLTKTTVSESFYGTTFSKSGLWDCLPDTIDIYSLPNDNFTTETESNSFDGLYNFEKFASSDEYAGFLDGTHSLWKINKKDGERRKTLLVVKDSFGDSLIPFLARHFDIVALNLSAGMTDITDYVNQYDADAVLIVFNAENVITTAELANVK